MIHHRATLYQLLTASGFPEVPEDRIHRSKLPYLAAFNGPSALVHAVEALNALGVSLRRARLLPDIGRVLEPEIRTYRVENYLEGWEGTGSEPPPVRLTVNVREDNRLHRFLPLLAVGIPPREAVQVWAQGRAAPHVPPDDEKPPPPYSLLEGFHRFYLEAGAMPEDWTNQITPAERLSLQLCQRFFGLRDPGTLPYQIADRMLIVSGSILENRDNPLAGVIVNPSESLISQIGTALELVEVFLTQAMLTIAGADLLGGFEYILPFEPPSARSLPLVIYKDSNPDSIARWFNAYPHRRVASIEEQYDPRLALTRNPSEPRLWSSDEPGIQQAAERIASWFLNGSLEEEPWDPSSTRRKYKLPSEVVEPDEMLALAHAYLPDFLPDYPRQVFISGGMNVEGVLLGLIGKWLEQGSFLGMHYEDWALFSLEDQAMLCGLMVQRNRQTDQCAIFEAAVRLLIDEDIKTWMETYRKEKIALGTPLAQLGYCLPLGGVASLHAPSMMVRIPRDYTRDPEASQIERKLYLLECLFLPAHITTRHIWQVDWVRLGETAYLKTVLNPVNPDLIPDGVRLYDGYTTTDQ